MPSEMPMPSPDALSPSGLKSNSQFYSSYEGSNPRRRPSQEPIGKIVKDSLKYSDEISFQKKFFLYWFVCISVYIITSPAEVLKSVSEISLLLS